MVDQASAPVVPVTQEPNWLNAATCIENMQVAYDDAMEADPFMDGNSIPIDTCVDAGDLGVLIGLAEWAVAHRSAPPAAVPDAVEVTVQLLAFALRCAADNPAAIGSQRAASELLERLGIEGRDGWFFHTEEADLADARERLATLTPPPVATARDAFDLITGKPVEPWAQDYVDRALAKKGDDQ